MIYAQDSEAPKRGAYSEYKWPGAGAEGRGRAEEPQPTRVVDAEYKETK